MKTKAVSGIMLTLLFIGTLTLTFNIQIVEAIPWVTMSDKEIISHIGNTSSIAFTATVVSPMITNIWFQIRTGINEAGFVFSTCMEDVEIDDSRRLTITFVNPYDPRFDRLSCLRGDTIYMVDPYWFYDWPTDYVYGIATVHNNTLWPENTLTGYMSEITLPPAPPPPVGGKAIPINIQMNNPELPNPLIWLSTIILLMVTTIVFVKHKKKRGNQANTFRLALL